MALGLWTPPCLRGDVAAACRRVGLAHIEGNGVEADRINGAFFLRRACAHGDREGCARLTALGLAPIAGSRPGLKACSRANVEECKVLCDRGHRYSCFELAMGLGFGLRLAVSPDPALFALHQGCEGGVAAACYQAAHLVDRGELHFRLLNKACDLGLPRACGALASWRMKRLGWAYRAGRTDELAQLERACRAGRCGELARVIETKEPIRARQLRRRTCLFNSYCEPYAPKPAVPLAAPSSSRPPTW